MAWLKNPTADPTPADALSDPAHLLAEHRAATVELRRLRSQNADLRQQIDNLEQENELYVERIDELEALLAEMVAR